MKKIDKYSSDSTEFSLANEIKKYKKMVRGFSPKTSSLVASKTSPLSLIIPFAAASLSPFAIKAQCDAVVTQNQANLEDFNVDIDGNGSIDFVMDVEIGSLPDLFIHVFNPNLEFAGLNMGNNYYYPSRFTGGSLTSGANWAITADYGRLAFENYPECQWEGTAVVSGYVAFRLDGNRLGFMEISFDNVSGDVTIGDAGIQSVANSANTSIVFGDCPTPITAPVNNEITIELGDLLIEDSDHGVILTSPNGTCFRLKVDDNGALITESISCQ